MRSAVVEQELGREVVAAVDDEIVVGDQPLGVAGVEPQRVRLHANFGIERAHALGGERGLSLAAIVERVPGLAMQIAGLEPVGIDDAEPADACAGEILQHGNAEAARADHQHRRARRRSWPAAPTSCSAIWRE